MQDPEEIRLPEAGDTNEILPDSEEDSLEDSTSRWPLLPGAIFVFVGLAVLVALVVTLDSHRRNLLLGGTAAFLFFVFGFASLIVRSYNREKQKLGEQNPYRDDHIIK